MGSPSLLPCRLLLILVVMLVQLAVLTWALWAAYNIRMYPIRDFGHVIHEFDPWFNYRAAEYLAEHGTEKFFKWYDYKSWYPIGRPIGTTIYPGMQLTAVGIHEALKRVPPMTVDVPLSKEFRRWYKQLAGHWTKSRGIVHMPPLPDQLWLGELTVNEICCMIPPWFGSLASLICGLLAYEVSRSVNAGVVCVAIMAIIPAHLMRSVGGKFDNEAVAMAAICCTFWLWVRSVRTPSSWPFGLLAGLSYVYMVAAWGGYIFVLNMIGIHALMLVGLGRFNSGVHKAYTLFFVVGTWGAMQIPVVGWTPLRSLEQIGPLGVFLGYQVLAFCDFQRRRQKMDAQDFVTYRVKAFGVLTAALIALSLVLGPMGYFGPLSSRIRGLFVKHTKTGNPLVDSVAEHQPANSAMFQGYLNLPLDYALLGSLVCFFSRNNGCYFVALYGFIAMHFSLKMSRLVLICGPITSVMCSIWVGWLLDFLLEPFLLLLGKEPSPDPLGAILEEPARPGAAPGAPASGGKKGKDTKGKKVAEPRARKSKNTPEQDWPLQEWEEEYRLGGMAQFKRITKSAFVDLLPDEAKDAYRSARATWNTTPTLCKRAAFSALMVFYIVFLSGIFPKIATFMAHCDSVARSMSNAQVKYWGRDASGRMVVVDDHWQGYNWMNDNTPEDSRVMAWWDYGYQITGIGRRTSLADGNTWNHEQIATLGKFLSSPQKKAWNALRHLADYVLVWTGGPQDDLAISTHFARIGNSVFPDHCGDNDPTCTKFGFYGPGRYDNPTPMMKNSLVYNLVKHNTEGVQANEKLFQMVYESPRGMMRIFKIINTSQESRDWVADPKNRICDAPGSWYCVGQYPPAVSKLVTMRRNFSQVEDFNKKGEKSAYTKMIEEQQRGGKFNSDL